MAETEIPLGNQAFDILFSPTGEPIVYTGLLTGEIKAFKFYSSSPTAPGELHASAVRESESSSGQDFSYEQLFTIRPTKRTCRSLASSRDGRTLYSVTKDKTLHVIDAASGKVTATSENAHESAINRVKLTMPNVLATGDDEGVVKLWDTRTNGLAGSEIRAYTHHFDYISDFLWLEDKRHLVSTSGDGSLSVIDVRAKKTEPFAHSEDQEDELLSIAAIAGGSKTIVGTQSGILEVFNNSKSGWGDCVDRIPGHPHSVDTLTLLPQSLYPASVSSSTSSSTCIIATGSSDGLVRLVQLFPTKVLGVVSDHGDFPVERLALGAGGGAAENDSGDAAVDGMWLGSVSHDDVLRLVDLLGALEDSDDEGSDEEEGESDGATDPAHQGSSENEEDDSDEDLELPEALARDSDEDEGSTSPAFDFPSPQSNPVAGGTASESIQMTSNSVLDGFAFSGSAISKAEKAAVQRRRNQAPEDESSIDEGSSVRFSTATAAEKRKVEADEGDDGSGLQLDSARIAVDASDSDEDSPDPSESKKMRKKKKRRKNKKSLQESKRGGASSGGGGGGGFFSGL